MKCDICKDPMPNFDAPGRAHLTLYKTVNAQGEGHVHVHGDIDKKEDVREMLEIAGEEAGVALGKGAAIMPTEIVFHNKQRIGDMLMFTCAVRDFKAAFPHIRVNVIATAPHIWDFNPNVDRSLVPTETNTVKIGPSWLTNKSNSLDWHFSNAYRLSMEQALHVQIPQGDSRPDIYFTEEEYNAPRVIENPYWIICVNGEKGWGCKMYPFIQWQEFVNQNPQFTFVQIGTREDNPPRLQGRNVIDYVGRTQSKETGIRDLYKLFLNAEGSIGLVSFHMHLAGALHKPCIVVAGAREPVSFTRYAGHAYLSTDGMLPCAVKACWHCGIETCTNPVTKQDHDGNPEIVPKCADMISPYDITHALEKYYIGGRLSKTAPSEKPKPKSQRGPINVVKTPPKVEVIEEVMTPKVQYNTFGLSFGGGALLESDWTFIHELIEKEKIKKVLEFGCGLSTLLFQQWGSKIISYETMPHWIERIKKINPSCDIRIWDGKNLPHQAYEFNTFDLAFVDGPSGGHNREHAVRIASESAKFVIVHDGHGEFEKEWQKRYLEGKFEGPIKNKGRCWLWKRKGGLGSPMLEKEKIVENHSYKPQVETILEGGCECVLTPDRTIKDSLTVGTVGTKTVKIVSTARGWGGQARSVMTIMKLLLNAGHRVEFIPFRNAVTSSEWKALLESALKDVKVTTNYDTVRENCDVLLMYADDFIWEFKDPLISDAFSEIGAERKIMMLNYRRGSVGETSWTKDWDKYMFLNSSQERELLKYIPNAKTKVLPPCTDLAPFLNMPLPNYEGGIRIVRHSSQGDTKFDKENFVGEVFGILDCRLDSTFQFIPGPSFLPEVEGRVKKSGRTSDPNVIAKFLSTGNLFWYSLPRGYMDQGPRVVLEAMAAGLPILADNWGGAKDRVPRGAGWLCDTKAEHIEIIKHVTATELKRKGEAARAHAAEEFVPEKWLKELLT